MTHTNPISRTHIEQELSELSLSLPRPAKPVASYIPTTRSGNQVFVSGQIPVVEGKLIAEGLVPTQVSEDEAQQCARRCVLNALAAVFAEIDDVNEGIVRILKLGCFVASPAEYTGHPTVANGASELLGQIMGEAGRHARAAIGCSSLPLNAPVEIEMIVEVGPLS